MKKGWEGKEDTSLDQFSAVKEDNCGPATLKTINKRLISKYDQKRNRKNCYGTSRHQEYGKLALVKKKLILCKNWYALVL